jgi:hypothetical protein
VFSDFAQAAEVDGIRFSGAFGILNRDADGPRWLLSSESGTFMIDGFGFADATPVWAGEILRQDGNSFTTGTHRPADWESLPNGIMTYVLVGSPQQSVGLPVRATGETSIETERFPLQPAEHFHLANVRYLRSHTAAGSR